MERDRKKEKKKIKGSEGGGTKKGAQGAAGAMVAGVPTAMPVSVSDVFYSILVASIKYLPSIQSLISN